MESGRHHDMYEKEARGPGMASALIQPAGSWADSEGLVRAIACMGAWDTFASGNCKGPTSQYGFGAPIAKNLSSSCKNAAEDQQGP